MHITLIYNQYPQLYRYSIKVFYCYTNVCSNTHIDIYLTTTVHTYIYYNTVQYNVVYQFQHKLKPKLIKAIVILISARSIL